MQPLNPQRFDQLVAPRPQSPIIWGAKRIAERIGRSEDFVRRTLVNLPGSPVQRRGRNLCAVDAELLAFFGAAGKR